VTSKVMAASEGQHYIRSKEKRDSVQTAKASRVPMTVASRQFMPSPQDRSMISDSLRPILKEQPKRQPKARFVLVLQADGPADEAETARRLRGALKTLLRGFGLRAVSVVPVPPQPAPDTTVERQAAA
jgi:hypothetical protein